MKSLFPFLGVLFTLNVSPANATEASLGKVEATGMATILKNPLILGASVSRDHLTESPGKRLALRYTASSNIEVRAEKGKPAREILKGISVKDLQGRSAILGIDLFFWDSLGTPLQGQESVKALEKLARISKELNVPMILGEVPELFIGMQKNMNLLNKKIRKICAEQNNCFILPLNKILHQVLGNGSIVQNGKTFTLDQLLPDGLHISAPASEYLADQIEELIREKFGI